ncbi:MAG TPA: glucosyl-3-phosphoglycerate synthase [Sediminispirochaeta sp.]|nr:glucosyl-3-phosphoglycerate synthase [Sediminispirochaeta sp.]
MNYEWWLKERTFHHSQFVDLDELIELKKRQKLKISVCLPTLNEAKTIGRQIKLIKRFLMEERPLVDELCVVDSGSDDRTRQIARKAGARVHLADQTLPDLTSYRGKGENLWKSLYLTEGDIMVWVDADIRNFHPRFIYGLVGPILQNPEISYVKSFYRRPLKVGRKTIPGGGRVTELMVRPYLNLLFPDLAMMAQPLSGEYAGRRSVLERLPFFTGYGVEMGLLIDIEQRYGIQSMAQVDMDVRVHRNQSIESLRRMSYVILSILLRRSEQLGKIALLEGVGHQLQLIKRDREGYFFDAEEVRGQERPPMLTIPAYQERYGIDRDDALLVEGYHNIGDMAKCFSQLLDESLIDLDLQGRSREEVLDEMLTLVAKSVSLHDPQEIIRGLLSREKRISTNVGHGVAIPHLVTEQVQNIYISFGRSIRGVDFRSTIVRRPVHLIFLLLSPPSKENEYLQTISCLARLLRHRKVIEDFLAVGTPGEAVALMKKYEALLNLQKQLKLQLLI